MQEVTIYVDARLLPLFSPDQVPPCYVLYLAYYETSIQLHIVS